MEVTYLGELKHDAQVGGVRFIVPTIIPPGYGMVTNSVPSPSSTTASSNNGIQITVDVLVDADSFIQGIQSPSHPIGMTLGRTSLEHSAVPHRASATLSLGKAELEKDFALLVLVTDQDIPRGLLEHHPRYLNQRALMVTPVPKLYLPPPSNQRLCLWLIGV